MAVLYLAIQLLVGYVLIPLIQHRIVSIPPALLIAMIAVFGTWHGMLGVLLAAPLTATGMVLVRRLYIEELLEDRPARPAA